MPVTRRQVLAGAAALGCVAAGPPPPGRGGTTVTPWPTTFGTAYVVAPTWGLQNDRFPLLVALHGRGEARKGPARGGLGWPEDYALTRMIERLCAPPITGADLQGFVDEGRLADQNAALARAPFRGLVVACPYVPDLEMYDDAALDAYGDRLIGELLPRLAAEAPVWGTPETTGIDGVSLGGRVALHVGLRSPGCFRAVGALQPAVRAQEAATWTRRAQGARSARPDLALRLLTSDGDVFRPAVQAIGEAWRDAGVPHELAVVPGPHDYAFNRGPGALELLLFHDRALRPVDQRSDAPRSGPAPSAVPGAAPFRSKPVADPESTDGLPPRRR